MPYIEKEIRDYELVFITALIISILGIMNTAFHNLWFWLPFLVVAYICIGHLIKRMYLSFVVFDVFLVMMYITIGVYFLL